MKVSNISFTLALLLGSSVANASEESRKLTMTAAEKKAERKAARQAKKAAKKATMEEPAKGMYFELVYVEREIEGAGGCTGAPTIGVVCTAQFELYEKSMMHGTHGAKKVGVSYTRSEIIDLDLSPGGYITADLTVTDYIDGGIGGTYIRSEGINQVLLGVEPGNIAYSLATIGGINEAKGIRGQFDAVKDDYKDTTLHVYHVEAWNMGPQPDYW